MSEFADSLPRQLRSGFHGWDILGICGPTLCKFVK